VTFNLFRVKIGTPVSRAVENVYDNFDFSAFVFQLRVHRGQTDRQTGKTHKAAYKRRPHNNSVLYCVDFSEKNFDTKYEYVLLVTLHSRLCVGRHMACYLSFPAGL